MPDKEDKNMVRPSEKPRKAVIAVLSKEEVVQMVNDWSAEALANVDSKVSKVIPERFYDLTAPPAKKEILSKLGVNAETNDDFRLAIYFDGAQVALLSGKLDDNTKLLNLTQSIRATNATDEDVSNRILQVVGQVCDKNHKNKDLLRPIVVPVGDEKTLKSDGRFGIRNLKVLELNQNDAAKLEAEVTLLALSEKSKAVDVAFSAENPQIPNKPDRNSKLCV